jgi:hypothetical protein
MHPDSTILDRLASMAACRFGVAAAAANHQLAAELAALLDAGDVVGYCRRAAGTALAGWAGWAVGRWAPLPPLAGATLRDATLCGATLRGADLEGATLRGAVLLDADLSGAIRGDFAEHDAELAARKAARAVP